MILSVTLNVSVDVTLYIEGLRPYETNRVQKSETDIGGKGVNLSRIVAELGGTSVATGFCGELAHPLFAQKFADQDVLDAFILTADPSRTNFSVEDGSGKPPTTLNAAGPTIRANEWAAFLDQFEHLLKDADWVTLGGSIPHGVEPTVYETLGSLARQQGRKFLLDADGDPLKHGLNASPHLIKPNLREAARLLERDLSHRDDVIRAAKDLRPKVDPECGMVMISMGGDGAVLATQERLYFGESPAVEAISTIGCGDSMLGAFLGSLERGDDAAEALRWGLAAGAATAATDGSEIGRRPVIELLWPEAKVYEI